jgi:hypothetical protein
LAKPGLYTFLTHDECNGGAQTARGMKIVPHTNNVRLVLERPGERAARRSTGKKCPRNWLRRRLARQTRCRRWKLPGTLSVERRSAQKLGCRSCFAAARRSQPEPRNRIAVLFACKGFLSRPASCPPSHVSRLQLSACRESCRSCLEALRRCRRRDHSPKGDRKYLPNRLGRCHKGMKPCAASMSESNSLKRGTAFGRRQRE